MIEFVGKSTADTTYTGRTGRRYRFGNNQHSKRLWVHPEDAQRFLRRSQFRGVRKDEVVHPETESPVLTAGGMVQVKAPAPVKVVAAQVVEASVPDKAREEPIGVEAPIEVEETLPDPGMLTLKELFQLELTPTEWTEMWAAEMAGKNRKTAVNFLKKKAEALRDG